MSYEIPKNLKYEEKVFFNLSLPQAAWMALFLLPAAAIFLRAPMQFNAKAVIATILTLLGLGFAFLDLKEHLANAINFLSKPREVGYQDKEMARFVEVRKINDAAVHLNNGSAKAVIQVQPINFHILSGRQQRAIISAYRDFLNSLDFPIQIAMRTVNLDLGKYMDGLEAKVTKRKKARLQKQFRGFRDFTKVYLDEHAVKNRLFYIVIPSDEKKPEAALEQLEIRAKLCQEKLRNCSLSTKRLSTNELVAMLSSYFGGQIEDSNEHQASVTSLEKNHCQEELQGPAVRGG